MPLLVGATSPELGGAALDLKTQAFLGESGITLNGTDAEGCAWSQSSNPWGDKPAPREQIGDRAYDHGQWDATRYYGPRVLAVTGGVTAPTHAALHRARYRLSAAVNVAAMRYRVTEPGYDGWAWMRQQGELQWTETAATYAPTAAFSFGLFAADPLIYSSQQASFSLDFPVSVGGLTWPATWPATWATEAISGTTPLTNLGDFDAPLRLRVVGPAAKVTIAFPEEGLSLNLLNPDGPLLRPGEFLDLDTARRQVLLMGEASRRSWAYGDWLRVPAGGTSKIAIGGSGTTDASSVSGAFYTTRI